MGEKEEVVGTVGSETEISVIGREAHLIFFLSFFLFIFWWGNENFSLRRLF